LPSLKSLEQKIDELRDLVLMALQRPAAKERDASIDGFCRRHGISRSHYLNLRRDGKGPEETATGRRRTISEEAEAEWLEARQREAAAVQAGRGAAREARLTGKTSNEGAPCR
jgi:hypothetical protein